MTDIEPEEDLPPVAHVTIVYSGPIAPHWDLQVRYGDQKLVDDFWARVNARLLLLPKHDPQFRRNKERVNRDAERERITCDWDLGEDDAETTITPVEAPVAVPDETVAEPVEAVDSSATEPVEAEVATATVPVEAQVATEAEHGAEADVDDGPAGEQADESSSDEEAVEAADSDDPGTEAGTDETDETTSGAESTSVEV